MRQLNLRELIFAPLIDCERHPCTQPAFYFCLRQARTHHPPEVPFFWPKERPMIKSNFSILKVRWQFFHCFSGCLATTEYIFFFFFFFRDYFSTAFKIEITAIMCNKRFFNYYFFYNIFVLCDITRREYLQKFLKNLEEQIQVPSLFPRCLKWI